MTLRDLDKSEGDRGGAKEGDLPTSIAGGVLLAGRGKGLCELVNLVLYELGGEDETWAMGELG